MKSMLKCSSLIRVVFIIVVMAFMASQVTDTYAGRNRNNSNNEECNHVLNSKGKCKICKKIIKIIINNNYDTNGQNENGNGNGNGNQNGGNAECPTCCDAWDKLLTDDRFELVMNDKAVLA